MSKNTITSITFSWAPGANNGGSSVIDYQLSYTDSTVFTVF
jgi:hypothetical protein